MHSKQQPNHVLKQVISKSSLQALTKKTALFEQLFNNLTTEKIRDNIDCEMQKLLATMKSILKIPNQVVKSTVKTAAVL